MREFKDRVAVVTGAASGIGRGLAERFASERMHVVLADVEAAPLDAAEREMRDAGASVLAVRTDVSKAEDVQELATRSVERFGGVHIVCNNAGVGSTRLSWDESLEDWSWVLGVNLWGVIHGVRTFVPIMLQGGDEGHIVNTASVAGLMPGGGAAAYTVSKFGVIGLSEALYHELKMTSTGKIGVSVLCPAVTDTNIMDSGRNRPGGPGPAPAPGTREAFGIEMMRRLLRAGQSPTEVAQQVFDAIVANRFYVLTHPEHNGVITKRAEAMLAGDPPPAVGTQ
ncbi:MAG: SDR family NAD(P)-dependent oxidoreductase [Chloroflexota bacterium]|nr:SDR family NAD(P)-dependent oxidoreductase [Chloroflexota bacterium]